MHRAQNYICQLAHDNWICHWTSEIAAMCYPWNNFAVYSQDNQKNHREGFEI